MMHYRCKECAEVFALERIRESGAPRTSASFCPFCGAQSVALASLNSIKLAGADLRLSCPCGDGTRPGHPAHWCGQGIG